jgi:NAD(P)H dehydrogenase (quinone)
MMPLKAFLALVLTVGFVGGGAIIYSPRGLNGEMDTLLFPIQHGMLYFLGFDVLPPFVAWSVARSSPQQREEYLRTFGERLLEWRTTAPIPFPPLEHYDETFQLKTGSGQAG